MKSLAKVVEISEDFLHASVLTLVTNDMIYASLKKHKRWSNKIYNSNSQLKKKEIKCSVKIGSIHKQHG